MSKLSALSGLLLALSRIPGLSFLRSIARTGMDASYMQSSMQSVKREFGGTQQPQTPPPPQQPPQQQQPPAQPGQQQQQPPQQPQ